MGRRLDAFEVVVTRSLMRRNDLTANREALAANAAGFDDHHGSRLKFIGVSLNHFEQSDQPLRATHVLVSAKDDDRGGQRATHREQLSEVGVARDQDPTLASCKLQDNGVVRRTKPDINHVKRVKRCLPRVGRKTMRQRLVEQQRYLWTVIAGSDCRGAFSTNRTASWRSSASRSGKSPRISSGLIPARSMPTTVATGMRIPRMQGTPPICSARIVMRGNPWTMANAECSAPPPSQVAASSCAPFVGVQWVRRIGQVATPGWSKVLLDRAVVNNSHQEHQLPRSCYADKRRPGPIEAWALAFRFGPQVPFPGLRHSSMSAHQSPQMKQPTGRGRQDGE